MNILSYEVSTRRGQSQRVSVLVSMVVRMPKPDWNLNGASLAALQFAEWLDINGSADNFADQYETDLDRAWAAAEARSWVETIQPNRDAPRRLGDRLKQPWAKLTGEGHLKVEEARGLRKNRLARATACREGILLWLADDGHGASSLDPFTDQGAFQFYGSAFTASEVDDAARFLLEVDLIRGIKSFGPGLSRPELTARGSQCVEFHNGNVRNFLNPHQSGGSVTYNQNFNAPVSGQVGQGQTVNQTQGGGIDAAALAEIFQAMREALSSVEDDDDRDDVSHAIQELEVAVENGDRQAVEQRAGRLKRLGSRVGTTVVTTATAVGTTQILHAFGLA